MRNLILLIQKYRNFLFFLFLEFIAIIYYLVGKILTIIAPTSIQVILLLPLFGIGKIK